MEQVHSRRRRFIAGLAGVTGGSWLALHAPAILAAADAAARQQEDGASLAHLEPETARTLGAVADQVIPPDDLPGASELGVVYFIDNVLGGFMADVNGLLVEGATDLDRAAAAACPGCSGFADLPLQQQAALLEAIEDSPFFNLMITLTHWGLFAAPSWGGNLDKGGWALLGFQDRHAWEPPFGYYDAALEESAHGG
jgi:gluconate 2-dehydrogenase gamma chain